MDETDKFCETVHMYSDNFVVCDKVDPRSLESS